MIVNNKHFYNTTQLIKYLRLQGKSDNEILETLIKELGIKRMYANNIINYESGDNNFIHDKD